MSNTTTLTRWFHRASGRSTQKTLLTEASIDIGRQTPHGMPTTYSLNVRATDADGNSESYAIRMDEATVRWLTDSFSDYLSTKQ